MNIEEFKPGDIITRVEPCVYLNHLTSGNHLDDRFIGKKITFLGLKNGMIYGLYVDDIQTCMMAVPIHRWGKSGWDYWTDPMSLMKGVEGNIITSLTVQLFEAESRGAYEECCRLRDEIKRLETTTNSNGNGQSSLVHQPGIKMIS